MTADLSALIARLEAAEVGSRELDGDLYWVLQRPNAERAYWNAAMGLPCKLPNDFVPSGIGQHGVISASPKFTTSLDAALALVERVLPEETFWEMSHNAVINGQRMYHADVFPPEQSGEATFWGYGSTPALALVIATLRAKQGEV